MNSDEYKDYIERLASGRKVVTESKPALDASKLANDAAAELKQKIAAANALRVQVALDVDSRERAGDAGQEGAKANLEGLKKQMTFPPNYNGLLAGN